MKIKYFLEMFQFQAVMQNMNMYICCYLMHRNLLSVDVLHHLQVQYALLPKVGITSVETY